MALPTQREIDHIFESLRKGLVPERGLDTFAERIDRPREEIVRQLDLVKSGEGSIKFLRGGYGCGKTFMARVALMEAQERRFVTSFVVVSDNDLHFHRFDDVYRKVMIELGTVTCGRGALGDILDRWIAHVEGRLIAAGLPMEAPDFDGRVRQRLREDLLAMTGGKAPQDFVRVVQTIFDLKQEGALGEAGALLSWLCGSTNVSATAKKRAGIRGDITSRDALDYLRGVLEIVKAAGYTGMMIVIDEAETILRMRTDVRHRSLNGIRQIADAAGSYPGLLWLFTGTPDFFDRSQGVAGLAPLHERIRFLSQNGFVSLRQAQLLLEPFDRARLGAVARRLRAMYPAREPARFLACMSDRFIDRLVEEVMTGFRGDVGVVPRQFLRALVTQMDLVDEIPGYLPERDVVFEAGPMTPEEQLAASGSPVSAVEGGPVQVEDVW